MRDYEPKGKMAMLLAEMRVRANAPLWEAEEAARFMGVPKSSLGAYTLAASNHGALHSKSIRNKLYYACRPITDADVTAKCAELDAGKPKYASDPRAVMHAPVYKPSPMAPPRSTSAPKPPEQDEQLSGRVAFAESSYRPAETFAPTPPHKCDGEHRGPRCAAPAGQCWFDDPKYDEVRERFPTLTRYESSPEAEAAEPVHREPAAIIGPERQLTVNMCCEKARGTGELMCDDCAAANTQLSIGPFDAHLGLFGDLTLSGLDVGVDGTVRIGRGNALLLKQLLQGLAA